MGLKPKTRERQLRDAIMGSDLPASDKSVFRCLLDKADFSTAHLPAKFTPTRKVIARETSLSYRQVGYSTSHLQRHGWLEIKGATGPGHPLEYELALGVARLHRPGSRTATLPTVATERWQWLPPNSGNHRWQRRRSEAGFH